MLSRRMLLGTALAVAGVAPAGQLWAQAAVPANDPASIVNAIYARVVKNKGDGGFVTADKAARGKYLSKALAELWAKAEAHTPKDEAGPIDFDPVSNSQDPDVTSFTVTTEKADSAAAVIAVRLIARTPRVKPDDAIVRYEFTRDGGHWKIDDIRGASDGVTWSVRSLLAQSLKG